MTLYQAVTQQCENVWTLIGSVAEMMKEDSVALSAYNQVLHHNPYNLKVLGKVAAIFRSRDQFAEAISHYQRIIRIDSTNGEVWCAMGHCYLLNNDLQLAYQAYEDALNCLPNTRLPSLWYGIGILFERYGSLESAVEAFRSVLEMDPNFGSAAEIHFRLGVLAKRLHRYPEALEEFRLIQGMLPAHLTETDFLFQIGHVHELTKNFALARQAYEAVLKQTAHHPKAYQQLGWLHYQEGGEENLKIAINLLSKSLEQEAGDAQTWYLLGRCYIKQDKIRKAYDAYQQAIYRDPRNPSIWCSIGVLLYEINQCRDALTAFGTAIRINPYLSEAWYDVGTLYECCDQLDDAIEAYRRALDLDPNNRALQERLSDSVKEKMTAKAAMAAKEEKKASKHKAGNSEALPPEPSAGRSEKEKLPPVCDLPLPDREGFRDRAFSAGQDRSRTESSLNASWSRPRHISDEKVQLPQLRMEGSTKDAKRGKDPKIVESNAERDSRAGERIVAKEREEPVSKSNNGEASAAAFPREREKEVRLDELASSAVKEKTEPHEEKNERRPAVETGRETSVGDAPKCTEPKAASVDESEPRPANELPEPAKRASPTAPQESTPSPTRGSDEKMLSAGRKSGAGEDDAGTDSAQDEGGVAADFATSEEKQDEGEGDPESTDVVEGSPSAPSTSESARPIRLPVVERSRRRDEADFPIPSRKRRSASVLVRKRART